MWIARGDLEEEKGGGGLRGRLGDALLKSMLKEMLMPLPPSTLTDMTMLLLLLLAPLRLLQV